MQKAQSLCSGENLLTWRGWRITVSLLVASEQVVVEVEAGGTIQMKMCTPELKAVNGITVISYDKN